MFHVSKRSVNNPRSCKHQRLYAASRFRRVPENADPMHKRHIVMSSDADRLLSCAAEQELEVFWAQAVHGNLVVVDCTSNHSSFLLLQRHHTRLDTILNTETGDHTGSLLTNAMASISGLPFSSRIPPSVIRLEWTLQNILVNLRINNEDSRGFGQVESNTTSFE
jgi:hypothetical protein